ncbi:hypothetical protein Cni_G03872 [Canna indica]|uniref:Uncharacterized protein n=1 Tax=Canna indica TaxID=4628 RepID=A0AAQ3JVN9_9LILI|nr:hypothetical protein Cni_G03872 [Canna indica]
MESAGLRPRFPIYCSLLSPLSISSFQFPALSPIPIPLRLSLSLYLPIFIGGEDDIKGSKAFRVGLKDEDNVISKHKMTDDQVFNLERSKLSIVYK